MGGVESIWAAEDALLGGVIRWVAGREVELEVALTSRGAEVIGRVEMGVQTVDA